MQVRGIIPPVCTPLTGDEEIDFPRFQWFLDHSMAQGVHGLFVLGTNSEFYAFDDREKQELMATAVAHVNHRVPVLIGTGAVTTREAVRLTKMAEHEGADAVSVLTPFLIAPTQQELFEHYRRIAASTSLGVILYSNPGSCGGLKIDVDTAVRLAEIPNILGVKDSSGDLQHTIELIRAVPEQFAVLMGRDTLIYPALIFGARGAVPATSNILPALVVEIYEAFQRGDHAAAKAAQLRLNAIRVPLSLGTAPGTVKEALALMGRSIGPSRAPVGALSAENRQLMKNMLRKAGFLE